MKSPARRALLLSLLAILGSSAVQACKKKDDGSGDELVPPTLEFLGATNTAGDEFKPGDDLVTACDGYLVLHLGPEGDDRGTIENWTLEAPHHCGSRGQCGYITIEFLNDSDEVVADFEQSVASPFLELAAVEVAEVTQLRATLTLGDSGVPFENEGITVSALWEGSLSRECETTGSGGSGGENGGSGGNSSTGGAPGTGGNDPGTGGAAFGGAGGLGGGGAGG